ncbi:NAD(P)/FAD-dependent oxidoreductase [Streptomyces atratus]|uniref:NAD(P)/FAD-dependent oxidoreductase n=1 Tax=Streptomyces atratus TaxID=1893 RepID=UPI00225380C4|nr:FAD-dependent oxidoreductase [Streptomyces atratus]MCX5345374.1 FAD-dependent oxidoreductase [Streptomyces atratus]
MRPDGTVVIAGAGQGDFQTAASLRDGGHAGPVVFIGDETGLPYQRPPLSKGFLQGNTAGTELRGRSFYERRGIELRHGRAAAIDRAARRVRLADGSTLAYDHLVLATGARNRTPPISGTALDGLLQLRTRAEAERLRARLSAVSQVSVIGAGFIGMEVAAAAVKAGATVTVVEPLGRPMARSLSAVTSAYVAELHRSHGARLLLGSSAVRLHGGRDGAVEGVELDDSSRVRADLVIAGVGVAPATELAADAGLKVGDGIRVDAFLTTSDPDVSALGDCADFPSVHAGAAIRLESVQNAVDQARCVAARLTGTPAPYEALPWFWTEQFSAKLQIAGLGRDHDRTTVLGAPATDAFSVLRFKNGRLTCVESVNAPGDHIAARRVLASGNTPCPGEAAEDGFSLRDWAAHAT